MSAPRTGQLGGYRASPGLFVLGGDAQPGDVTRSHPGIVRHYRFNEPVGATHAEDESGHDDLVSANATPLLYQVPGVEDVCGEFTSALGHGGCDQAYHGAAFDAAALFPTGGMVSLSFRIEQRPAHWGTTFTENGVTYTGYTDKALIFGFGYGGGFGAGLAVWTDPEGFVWACVGGGGGTTSAHPVSVETWHTLKVAWDTSRGMTRVALDGDIVHSIPALPFQGGNTGANWHLCLGGGLGVYGGNDVGGNFLLLGDGSHLNTCGFIGEVDDLAVYNTPDATVFASRILVSASTSFSAHATSLVREPSRFTQAFSEVINDKERHLRVSQALAEVIRTGNYRGRISQAFVEVLCDAPHPIWNVSATTGVSLHGTSTVPGVGHPLVVSATSGLGVHSTSTTRVGYRISVSASTAFSFTVSARGYVPASYTLSATTGLLVAGSGGAVVHNPQPYWVSAGTTFALSEVAGIGLARAIPIAATTRVALSSTAYAPTTFRVDASSRFFLAPSGSGRTPSLFVSASSGLFFHAPARVAACYGPKFVSAASSFRVVTPADVSANLLLHVSAVTSMALADLARSFKRGPLLVSAASRFRVSALTSETANLGVSASGGFALAAAGRQNRGISAAATTGLGLGNTTKTGNLKAADARATATFTVSATSLVTGTLAASGLEFADLAQAVVWIPWRRAGLTRPDGGNLPHS